MGKRISQREKREIAYPVAKRFSNEKLEFPFKKTYFDIVSYDNNKSVFKIFECKIVNRMTSIGATFGQILTYSALISKNGRTFLDTVFELKHWPFTSRTLENMFQSKKIPVEFYVAFRRNDIEGYEQFLDWAYQNFLDRKIGIILVDRGRCEIVKYSKPIDIPFNSSYTSLQEATLALRDIVQQRHLIPESRVRIAKNFRFIQFFFGTENIHFEIWFSDKHKTIELGLHIEAGKTRNKKIFNALRKRQKTIRRALPDVIFDDSGDWRRICSREYWNRDMKILDDVFLEGLAIKLKKYVDVLRPMLEKMNWGRIFDSKTQDDIIMKFIMGDGTRKNSVTTDQIFDHVKSMREFGNYKDAVRIRGHAIYKAKKLCKRDKRFGRVGKRIYSFVP